MDDFKGTGRRGLLLGMAAAGLLTACGGGLDRTKAQVRFVNASLAYDALDLVLDGALRAGATAYGQGAAYVEVDPDDNDGELRRTGSDTALVSFTPSLRTDAYFTVLAYGREGALRTLLLDDNANEPDSGKTVLRVLNAAPDAGSLDVYLTGTDDTLAGTVPVQAGAGVGTLNGALTLNAGTRRLRVTAAGSKTDVRLDLSGVVLPSRGVLTLVLTPSAGGVLVNALLLADRGGITRLDTTQARVRLAAALPAGGTVGASVGGTTLATAAGAPSVGLYALVPAGTLTPAVTVNGVAVPAAAVTLDPGAEHTLMVYGTLAAPVVVWLDDDNQLPADSAKAKLRLVHGVGDLAGSLSLSVDFLPVADSVTPGTGSAYDGTVESSSAAATLTVTTPGALVAVFSAVDQTIVANAVYTLFVVGATAGPPAGILRRDR